MKLCDYLQDLQIKINFNTIAHTFVLHCTIIVFVLQWGQFSLAETELTLCNI